MQWNFREIFSEIKLFGKCTRNYYISIHTSVKFSRSQVLCSSITGIFRVLKIYYLPVQWIFRVLKKYIFQCREFFRVLSNDNFQCSEISGTEKKTNYSSGIFPRLWKWPGFRCTHSPPKFPAHLCCPASFRWTFSTVSKAFKNRLVFKINIWVKIVTVWKIVFLDFFEISLLATSFD